MIIGCGKELELPFTMLSTFVPLGPASKSWVPWKFDEKLRPANVEIILKNWATIENKKY
jgi:hypothetical protein